MSRSSAEQHPIMLGLGILFAVAFVITYWPIFVAAAIAYGAYLTARAAVRRHRRQMRVHAAIAARADYEHAAIIRGDDWLGTFGRYQPAPCGGPNSRAAFRCGCCVEHSYDTSAPKSQPNICLPYPAHGCERCCELRY
jgi:hypothetical protein